MKILALEKEIEGKTSEDFEPFLKTEARHVWQLYKTNIIREIYFREDQSTAVIILECKDVAEAEKILSELPLVENRLIEFELIPLIAYDGFERIFA